jgi:hypothetical protein
MIDKPTVASDSPRKIAASAGPSGAPSLDPSETITSAFALNALA